MAKLVRCLTVVTVVDSRGSERYIQCYAKVCTYMLVLSWGVEEEYDCLRERQIDRLPQKMYGEVSGPVQARNLLLVFHFHSCGDAGHWHSLCTSARVITVQDRERCRDRICND